MDGRYARLRRVVTRLTPDQLRTFAASLDDPNDVGLLEEVVGDLAAEAERSTASLVHWRSDPARMAHHMTGGAYKLWPYVLLLGEAFANAVRGIEPRQQWQIASQYGKTTGLKRGIIWALDRDPTLRIMYLSYDAKKAVEEAGEVRDWVEQHRSDLRFRLRSDARARGQWKTEEGGGLYATGIKGGIVGYPADVVLLDDLIKGWQAAHSLTERDYVWNVYRSAVRMRLQGLNCPIIDVGTRWHEDDHHARLVAQAAPGEKWRIIRLPTIAEAPDPDSADPLLREPDPLGRSPGQILEPERFPEEEVQARRSVLGEYLFCTPGETPILMADWTCKPISQIMPGDEVVGFVCERGRKLRLTKSKVRRVAQGRGEVWDYLMDSGGTIRATRDHRWFTRPSRPYRPANVGTPLRFLCPTEEDVDPALIPLWNYLAGIIDGEGHFRPMGVIDICQTIEKNLPVADKIIEVLDRLGIQYHAYTTERADPRWADRRNVDIHNSAEVCRRLLRLTELAKRDQAAAVLFNGAGRTKRESHRVRAIHSPVYERVYALETDTGNYVAWGYLSSNSAMEQQRPAPAEGTEILREWFQVEETLPSRPDEAIGSWDMKLKDNESGDYVVGQCWWRVGGGYWLMDQFRGQWNEATTKVAIALMAVRHPEISRQYVENTGNAPELLAELRRGDEAYVLPARVADDLGMSGPEREAVQMVMRRGLSDLVPVVPKGSKSIRMRAVSGVLGGLNVHVPAGAPWLALYLDEMAAFPHGRDDQVDATSQALSKLSKPPTRTESAGQSVPSVPTRPSAVPGGRPQAGAVVMVPGVPRR